MTTDTTNTPSLPPDKTTKRSPKSKIFLHRSRVTYHFCYKHRNRKGYLVRYKPSNTRNKWTKRVRNVKL